MKKGIVNFSFYFTGLFIMTFGISFTIASKLGASPFDALLVGLTNRFGLTVGSWELLGVFSLFLSMPGFRRIAPTIIVS